MRWMFFTAVAAGLLATMPAGRVPAQSSAPAPQPPGSRIVPILCATDYPPYSYTTESGRLTGIFPDIVREVFRRMPDYDAALTTAPRAGLVAAVADNPELGMCLAPKPAGQQGVGHGSEPVVIGDVVVACVEEANLPSTRLESMLGFSGLRFAVADGVLVGGAEIRALREQGDITAVPASGGVVQALRLVVRRQADCIIDDRQAIQWGLAQLYAEGHYAGSGSDRVRIVKTMRPEPIVLSFGPVGPAAVPRIVGILARFNAILGRLQAHGWISRIEAAYQRTPGVLRVGIAEHQIWPHQFVGTDGLPRGIDIELSRIAAGRIGYRLEFNRMPWARAMDDLIGTRLDMLVQFTKTAQRQETILYAGVPTSEELTFLISAVDDPFEFKGDQASLAGREIGTIRGWSYGDTFDRRRDFTRIEVSDTQQLVALIRADRLDYGIGLLIPALRRTSRTMIERRGIRVSMVPVTRNPVYTALSRRPGHAVLIDRLTDSLERNALLGLNEQIRRYYEAGGE